MVVRGRYKTQYLPLLILCLAVLYTGWLLHHILNHSSERPRDNHQADFVLYHVKGYETNNKGQITERFTSPEVTHYPFENTYDYLSPHVLAYSNDGKSPWDIRANKGHSIKGDQKITLWDKVNFYQSPSPNNTESRLQTDWVEILPEQHLAQTDKPILFTQPGLRVTAVGMILYFKEKIVELKHKVKARYVEPSPTTV